MDLETKQRIDALLSGFKELDVNRHNQSLGNIFKKHGKCSACVGAGAAVFLDLPKQGSRWQYEDGVEVLEEIFGEDVDQLFRDCGAETYDPFGSNDWENPPYLVLHEAVKRKFGYDFEGSPTG